MKNKQRSVKQLLSYSFLILVAVVLVIIAVILITGYRTTLSQLDFTSGSNLSDYASSFSTDLKSAAVKNDLICASTDFEYFATGLADVDRVLPEYQLSQIIKHQTDSYAASILYEQTHDICDYFLGDSFRAGPTSVQDHEFIRSICSDTSLLAAGKIRSWYLYDWGGQYYLVWANHRNSTYLFSIVSISAYVSIRPIPSAASESYAFLLFENQLVFSDSPVEIEERHLSNPDAFFSPALTTCSGAFVQSVPIDECALRAGVVIPYAPVFDLLRTLLTPSLVTILLVIGVLYALNALISYTLLYPLQQIVAVSKEIEGNHTLPLDDSQQQHFSEYQEIRDSLNGLVQQVSRLETEKKNREIEKEHALLQYYQLQTRSHFLLNCLKGLYSLVDSANPDKLKAMIISTSNHLRYTFHDSISLVPLSAELAEIQAYHSTIQIGSARPLILIQNVPEELTGCLVPPLILQTFLENAMKYGVRSAEEALTFRIQISKAELDGKAYLQIRLSDNGNGYPADILEKLNSELSGTFDSQNIGINNLRRRISIIFKGDYRCAFYNLPGGGALSSIYIPLIEEGASSQ